MGKRKLQIILLSTLIMLPCRTLSVHAFDHVQEYKETDHPEIGTLLPGDENIEEEESSSGGQELVDFALTQVGSGGGKAWDYFGFKSDWCSEFVSYCAHKVGLVEDGIIPKYDYSRGGYDWFTSRGQYKTKGSGYKPKTGDIIFFGGSASDHTGIVVKYENGTVYTVEGNSGSSSTSPFYLGSSVNRYEHSLNDGWIHGYGIPKYRSFWENVRDNLWNYHKKDGEIAKDQFMKIDGQYYWFNENGDMVYGFREIGGYTYYFNEEPGDEFGQMKTGLVQVGSNWYYFEPETDGEVPLGTLVTGWKILEDKQYYFGENGAMFTGDQIIGDYVYHFRDDGILYSHNFFHMTDGTVKVYTADYQSGKSEEEWPAAEQVGSSFKGWKVEGSEIFLSSGGQVFNMCDTDYYPVFDVNSLYIEYDLNNGALVSSDIEQLEVVNDLISIQGNVDIWYGDERDQSRGRLLILNESGGLTVEKDGYYIQKGNEWIDQNGNTYDQSRAYSVSEFSALLNEENVLRLSVNWIPVSYTISYKMDGGKLDEALNFYTMSSPEIVLGTPAKEGYIFTGWTASDEDEPAMEMSIPSGSSGNKVFTAHWELDKESGCALIYSSESGTGLPDAVKDVEGDEIEISDTVPVRSGYTFSGWADEEENVYQPGDHISYDGEMICLTAMWEENSYTVHFDGNESDEGSMDDMTLSYAENAELPECAFSKDRYLFSGWNTERNGKGQGYAAGEEISGLTDKESVTLYAQWVKDASVHSITYFLGSDDVNEDELPHDYRSGETVELPNPSRPGYIFLGWTGSNGRQMKRDVVIGEDESEDLLYVANWKALKYNVVIEDDKGILKTVSKEYGTDLDLNSVISGNEDLRVDAYETGGRRVTTSILDDSFAEMDENGEFRDISVRVTWKRRIHLEKEG